MFEQNFRNSLEFAPLREFDLSHQLSRLRQGRQLTTSEATLIVQTLAQSVKTDAEITAVRLFSHPDLEPKLTLIDIPTNSSSRISHHTLVDCYHSLLGCSTLLPPFETRR